MVAVGDIHLDCFANHEVYIYNKGVLDQVVLKPKLQITQEGAEATLVVGVKAKLQQFGLVVNGNLLHQLVQLLLAFLQIGTLKYLVNFI